MALPNIRQCKKGTQASYDQMATHDSNVIYFVTDTHKVYVGDHLFSMIEVAPTGFPDSVADLTDYVNRYYISITTGHIYYVKSSNPREVADISSMFAEGYILSAEFISKLLAKFEKEMLKLPVLSVNNDEKKLVWNEGKINGTVVTSITYVKG